jgi:hypothetical protein
MMTTIIIIDRITKDFLVPCLIGKIAKIQRSYEDQHYEFITKPDSLK